MTKILIYHNVIAPYRHDLFAKISERAELIVWFAQEKSRDRQWAVKQDKRYDWELLRNFELRVPQSLVITPTLFQCLERTRPSIVLSVMPRPNLLDAAQLLLWCKLRKVPFVAWVANATGDRTFGVKGILALAADYLRDEILRRSTAFWSYSQATDKWLTDKGFFQSKITGSQVLGDPTSPPRLSEEKGGIRFKLVYVGKLDERKGLSTLVDALKQLPVEQRRTMSMTFVGVGPMRAELEAALHHVVEAHFLGHLDSVRLRDIYRMSDAIVLPSFYDPWGFVINEAMSAGTPAIASDKCGAAELAAKAGWVFNAGDPVALASTISLAHKGARQPEMRRLAAESEAQYRADIAAGALVTFLTNLLKS